MDFNFNGICRKCGCGTTGKGESKFQTGYELCFGCGSEIWTEAKKNNDGEVIISDGKPILIEKEKQHFGTCLTKDYKLITFTKKPSSDRIKELKENALVLVIWNEEYKWLDVVTGSPLMRKDVILLENDYSIKEYINEPECVEPVEDTLVNRVCEANISDMILPF